jgi:alcohol dehydrogenase class IV
VVYSVIINLEREGFVVKELRFHGDVVVVGSGSIEYIKKLDFNRVFLVTGGQSMFKNGSIDKIKAIVMEKGKEFYIHSGISKNPDTSSVLQGVEIMKVFKPDVVIAIGGGSPIDAAKAMTFFYEYPQYNFENIALKELPEKRKSLKFIAIPSTSGTATEVTKITVITYRDKDIKIGLKAPSFIPDISILDSDLTMSMPDNITAETGMDAMAHALECYINEGLDDYTEVLAKGAIEGLFKYLPLSYRKKDIESREKVHNYQCIAGMAFTNVGLGMTHGIAHAIGGKFDLAHGLINAVALPYVLKFNEARSDTVRKKLKYLERVIDSEDFIKSIKELNKTLNIPTSFKAIGISEEDFKENFEFLVENSLKGATLVNPVKVTDEDMKEVLKNIYEGIGL